MPARATPRLRNLLAAVTLNVADECRDVMEAATGLTSSAPAGLLVLDEFLEDTHVGRLADVLGLTHSGAVRLVVLLERHGLVVRRAGADRRRVEVRLTEEGRRRAAAARRARDVVLAQATSGLTEEQAATLEQLLDALVSARVEERAERRRAGDGGGAWWCRTCDFAACGRPEGRCPAQMTARRVLGL